MFLLDFNNCAPDTAALQDPPQDVARAVGSAAQVLRSLVPKLLISSSEKVTSLLADYFIITSAHLISCRLVKFVAVLTWFSWFNFLVFGRTFKKIECNIS